MKIPPIALQVELVNAVQRGRHHLLRLHQSLAPAPVVMTELIVGAWLAQAMTVAADLRIADALAEGPLGLDELADRVAADPDALRRLLRTVISRGVFRRRRDGRYDLTPLARTLRWEGPDSVAAFVRFAGSPADREHWSHCIDAVQPNTRLRKRIPDQLIKAFGGREQFVAAVHEMQSALYQEIA